MSLVGDVLGGQHRPHQVVEGVSECLGRWESHGWARSLKLSFIQEIWAAVRATAEDLGSFVDSVFPEWGQLL